MIIECPHCYLTVCAARGICPACRKPVYELAGTDPTRTIVKIHEGDRLPGRCALCDGPATQLARIDRVSRWGLPKEARVFLGVLALAVAPFALLAVVALSVMFAAALLCVLWLLLLLAVLLGSNLPHIASLSWLVARRLPRSGGAPPPIRRDEHRSRRPVRLWVPLCSRCDRGALEPTAVDTERHAMTFLVDRRFAERFTAAR